MTSRRPPRRRNRMGTVTVMNSPSGECATSGIDDAPRLALRHFPQLVDDRSEPVRPQRDAHAVELHVDAPNEQLDDTRLLGREELAPDRVDSLECPRYLALADWAVCRVRLAPSAHDDLGRAQDCP